MCYMNDNSLKQTGFTALSLWVIFLHYAALVSNGMDGRDGKDYHVNERSCHQNSWIITELVV